MAQVKASTVGIWESMFVIWGKFQEMVTVFMKTFFLKNKLMVLIPLGDDRYWFTEKQKIQNNAHGNNAKYAFSETVLEFYMVWCMFQSSQAESERMGSDGHEEGLEGVDSGCGLRGVWVRLGMRY